MHGPAIVPLGSTVLALDHVAVHLDRGPQFHGPLPDEYESLRQRIVWLIIDPESVLMVCSALSLITTALRYVYVLALMWILRNRPNQVGPLVETAATTCLFARHKYARWLKISSFHGRYHKYWVVLHVCGLN